MSAYPLTAAEKQTHTSATPLENARTAPLPPAHKSKPWSAGIEAKPQSARHEV